MITVKRIDNLIKNIKNGDWVHYLKLETNEMFETLKSGLGSLKSKELTLIEKNNQMYGIYYYLNDISCNRAPAVVFDDKYIASIFNDFYNTEKRYDINEIEKVVDLVSSQIGISKPNVHLKYDKTNRSSGYAEDGNDITLITHHSIESGRSMNRFTKTLEVIVHELTHIQQFAEIKAYFQGEPVEPKYALAGLSYISHFYGSDRERYGVLGALYKKVLGSARDYFYDIMEIDARVKACQYLINLVQNPYLCDGARKDIEKYLSLISINGHILLSPAKENLHLKNVDKKANLVFKNQIDYFTKRYEGADLLENFMRCYNDVAQVKDSVFEDLLKIENETTFKIIEALKKSDELRNNITNNNLINDGKTI